MVFSQSSDSNKVVRNRLEWILLKYQTILRNIYNLFYSKFNTSNLDRFCRFKVVIIASIWSSVVTQVREIVGVSIGPYARIRKIDSQDPKCRHRTKLQNVDNCTRFWPDLIRYILNKIIFIYFSRLEYI